MDTYKDLLRRPVDDDSKRAIVGPFPRIMDVDGQDGGALRKTGTNLLELSGEADATILPSLDVAELLETLKLDKLERITFIVGVNSDSYNRGLGVTLIADAITDANRDENDWYEYGAGELDSYTNAIKFHPDMGGGQLRVEGGGGFHNTDIGFTPPGWTASGENLTMLEITLGSDGSNEVLIKSAGGDESWTGKWNNRLIQGTRIPALGAHIDLGGSREKPLMIGQVKLRMETSASKAMTFFREYSVAMSKAIAGLLRLLLEDVAQAACQMVYMIKQWKLMSISARAFTFFSITSGVILSIIGPMAELKAARVARKKAFEAGAEGAIGLQESTDQYKKLPQEDDKHTPLIDSAPPSGGAGEQPSGEQHVWTRKGCLSIRRIIAAAELEHLEEGSPVTSSQLNQLADRGLELPELIKNKFVKVQTDKTTEETPAPRNVLTLRNIPLEDVLLQKGRGLRHVSRNTVYPLLKISSLAFWTLMITLPLILRGELSCDGGPPAISMYLFFAHTSLDLLAQLWISIQTRHGFILFAQMSPKFLLGLGLTCLCRFDTFGDVINTAKLFQCEPITWFSIKDYVFKIPLGIQLAHISLFTLVFGVLIAQALPGLLLLFRKTYLPIALKLNEFNLLLTVMLSEVDDLEFSVEEDLEKQS